MTAAVGLLRQMRIPWRWGVLASLELESGCPSTTSGAVFAVGSLFFQISTRIIAAVGQQMGVSAAATVPTNAFPRQRGAGLIGLPDTGPLPELAVLWAFRLADDEASGAEGDPSGRGVPE